MKGNRTSTYTHILSNAVHKPYHNSQFNTFLYAIHCRILQWVWKEGCMGNETYNTYWKKSIKVSDMMIKFPYLVIKACSRMNKKSGETYKYFKARYLECWWPCFGGKHGAVCSQLSFLAYSASIMPPPLMASQTKRFLLLSPIKTIFSGVQGTKPCLTK